MKTSISDEEREEALRLYDQGIPVAISNHRLRHQCEQHRWGRHGEIPNKRCPVCQRAEKEKR